MAKRYLGYYQEVNNQDEISKLNTDPQLAETIIIDRNSMEHTPYKVNQKYSAPLLKLKQNWTKSTWKPKNKACQGRSHLIYFQAITSSIFSMFVLCVI